MPIEADLHIHTKYSFDCLLEPKTVCKVASMRGLSAIAITDHNTLKGSLSAMHEASCCGNLVVIPGIEVKTDRGDVIGLYVQDEIKSREFYEVINEIRCQGGLVVLPHPYYRHKGVFEKLARYVDVIEVLNGRSFVSKNAKALELARSLGKPMIACSDAHFAFEIGRVRTRFFSDPTDLEELRKSILDSERELVGKESSFVVHGLTFSVEIFKRIVGFCEVECCLELLLQTHQKELLWL